MTLFSLGEHSATSATSATQLVKSFRVAVHRYRGIWENPTFGRLDGLASLANEKPHYISMDPDINHIKIVVKLLLKEKNDDHAGRKN